MPESDTGETEIVRFAADNLPTIRCWRCGEPADAEWHEVRTIDGFVQFIRGIATCSTPGCVDENGSNVTSPVPPSPQEIQQRADAVMDKFWLRTPAG